MKLLDINSYNIIQNTQFIYNNFNLNEDVNNSRHSDNLYNKFIINLFDNYQQWYKKNNGDKKALKQGVPKINFETGKIDSRFRINPLFFNEISYDFDNGAITGGSIFNINKNSFPLWKLLLSNTSKKWISNDNNGNLNILSNFPKYFSHYYTKDNEVVTNTKDKELIVYLLKSLINYKICSYLLEDFCKNNNVNINLSKKTDDDDLILKGFIKNKKNKEGEDIQVWITSGNILTENENYTKWKLFVDIKNIPSNTCLLLFNYNLNENDIFSKIESLIDNKNIKNLDYQLIQDIYDLDIKNCYLYYPLKNRVNNNVKEMELNLNVYINKYNEKDYIILPKELGRSFD